MLSILIPVYNRDCTRLVAALSAQACALRDTSAGRFRFEIIVADDASTSAAALRANSRLGRIEGCRYVVHADNLGRARIRNWLAREARYDHLLFMDCDAEVCTPDFLSRYWDVRLQADVVCGSLRNLPACPPGCALRYRYELRAARRRTPDFLNRSPYARFTAFNALFRRSVFARVCFDERCTEYGYEDALMGVMMQRLGISVVHVDIPLVHAGIDTSRAFLDKTEAALRVLSRLGEPMQTEAAVSRLARRLARFGLRLPVALTFRAVRPLLRRQLLGSRPSLLLLDAYKLGYYCMLPSARR